MFGEEDFNLGDSTSTLCSITKGDVPIKIWWTFQGENENFASNITTNDGIVISRNSQKMSLLGIESIKAFHKGNYSCHAQNKGGFTNHSAYLAINGSICEMFYS